MEHNYNINDTSITSKPQSNSLALHLTSIDTDQTSRNALRLKQERTVMQFQSELSPVTERTVTSVRQSGAFAQSFSSELPTEEADAVVGFGSISQLGAASRSYKLSGITPSYAYLAEIRPQTSEHPGNQSHQEEVHGDQVPITRSVTSPKEHQEAKRSHIQAASSSIKMPSAHSLRSQHSTSKQNEMNYISSKTITESNNLLMRGTTEPLIKDYQIIQYQAQTINSNSSIPQQQRHNLTSLQIDSAAQQVKGGGAADNFTSFLDDTDRQDILAKVAQMQGDNRHIDSQDISAAPTNLNKISFRDIQSHISGEQNHFQHQNTLPQQLDSIDPPTDRLQYGGASFSTQCQDKNQPSIEHEHKTQSDKSNTQSIQRAQVKFQSEIIENPPADGATDLNDQSCPLLLEQHALTQSEIAVTTTQDAPNSQATDLHLRKNRGSRHQSDCISTDRGQPKIKIVGPESTQSPRESTLQVRNAFQLKTSSQSDPQRQEPDCSQTQTIEPVVAGSKEIVDESQFESSQEKIDDYSVQEPEESSESQQATDFCQSEPEATLQEVEDQSQTVNLNTNSGQAHDSGNLKNDSESGRVTSMAQVKSQSLVIEASIQPTEEEGMCTDRVEPNTSAAKNSVKPVLPIFEMTFGDVLPAEVEKALIQGGIKDFNQTEHASLATTSLTAIQQDKQNQAIQKVIPERHCDELEKPDEQQLKTVQVVSGFGEENLSPQIKEHQFCRKQTPVELQELESTVEQKEADCEVGDHYEDDEFSDNSEVCGQVKHEISRKTISQGSPTAFEQIDSRQEDTSERPLETPLKQITQEHLQELQRVEENDSSNQNTFSREITDTCSQQKKLYDLERKRETIPTPLIFEPPLEISQQLHVSPTAGQAAPIYENSEQGLIKIEENLTNEVAVVTAPLCQPQQVEPEEIVIEKKLEESCPMPLDEYPLIDSAIDATMGKISDEIICGLLCFEKEPQKTFEVSDQATIQRQREQLLPARKIKRPASSKIQAANINRNVKGTKKAHSNWQTLLSQDRQSSAKKDFPRRSLSRRGQSPSEKIGVFANRTSFAPSDQNQLDTKQRLKRRHASQQQSRNTPTTRVTSLGFWGGSVQTEIINERQFQEQLYRRITTSPIQQLKKKHLEMPIVIDDRPIRTPVRLTYREAMRQKALISLKMTTSPTRDTKSWSGATLAEMRKKLIRLRQKRKLIL